jgi:transcriptional regulator with XRE-family HTH domain
VLRGLSQEKLAADAEVDRSYVGRLERAVGNPTVTLLDRLAAALQVPLADLFAIPKDDDRPKPLKSGRRRQVEFRTLSAKPVPKR